MNATPLGFQGIKVIAWSVSDLNRASRFYGETQGLPPACEGPTRSWLTEISRLSLNKVPHLAA